MAVEKMELVKEELKVVHASMTDVASLRKAQLATSLYFIRQLIDHSLFLGRPVLRVQGVVRSREFHDILFPLR